MKTILLLLLCTLISLNGLEKDKDYELKKRIINLKNEIKKYEDKNTELDNSIEELKQYSTERKQRRIDDLKDIKNKINDLRKQIQKEKRITSSQKNKIQNYKKQFELFKKRMLSFLDKYETHVKAGIPYKIDERVATVSRLKNDIKFSQISPEELFNRIDNFLNKELILGLDSEVYVQNDVKYLRLGNILMAYYNEVKKEEGLLTKKDEKWIFTTDLDYKTRQIIRDAIMMVEGKKAPELVNFPVYRLLINNN